MTTSVQLHFSLAKPARRDAPRLHHCRKCGCTDNEGCTNLLTGRICKWEEADLCSGCAVDAVPGWMRPRLRERAA
jgi:hypothetical protein